MKFTRIFTITIFALAALTATISCKKKEKTPTYYYLDGTLKLTAKPYVEAGATLEIPVAGVSHPKGEALNVWCNVAALNKTNDTLAIEFNQENGITVILAGEADLSALTDNKIEELAAEGKEVYTSGKKVADRLAFSATPQDYKVTCGVFKSGYVTSTGSVSFTAVKGGMDGTGSITNAGFSATDSKVSNPCGDGKDYFTINVNGTEWFRQNLAYEGELGTGGSLGKGVPYKNCEAMTDVFGLYYTHEQAKAACPSGWQLPEESDWVALMQHIAANPDLNLDPASFVAGETFANAAGALMPEDALFNDKTMWEYWPKVKKTDEVGFAALPVGYATKFHTDNFIEWGKYAAFWSGETAANGDGHYRYINVETPDILLGTGDSSFLASVRCIRK